MAGQHSFVPLGRQLVYHHFRIVTCISDANYFSMHITSIFIIAIMQADISSLVRYINRLKRCTIARKLNETIQFS